MQHNILRNFRGIVVLEEDLNKSGTSDFRDPCNVNKPVAAEPRWPAKWCKTRSSASAATEVNQPSFLDWVLVQETDATSTRKGRITHPLTDSFTNTNYEALLDV